MQRLLCGYPGYTGFFTKNGDRGFRADNGTDSTARAAFGDQNGRVITSGIDMVCCKAQYFLRTGCDTQFAAFAVLLIDIDPTL